MSRTRVFLLIPVVLAGLVVLLAAAFYGVARLAWFEGRLSSALSGSLGWPVEVGELAIGYFPSPWVEAGQVVIAGGEAGSAPPLAEVSRIRAELPWRTVFGRGLDIRRLELQGPRIMLEPGPGDEGNWEPFVRRVVEFVGEEPSAWSVGSLQVKVGSLQYGRSGERADVELSSITLAAEALSPATPFPVDLRLAGRVGERTFHAAATGRVMLDPDNDRYAADELVLAGWIGGDDLPLAGVDWGATVRSARADLAAGTALVRGATADALGVHVKLELEAAGLEATPSSSFSLATDEFSPRMAGFGVNRPLPATRDPDALSRARVELRGKLNGQSLVVESLRGQFDDTRFEGSLVIPVEGGVPQARLALDTIDLDRYLPPDDPQAPATTPQAALQELLAGLQATDVDAEVRIGEARVAGTRARGLRVVLEPLDADTGP